MEKAACQDAQLILGLPRPSMWLHSMPVSKKSYGTLVKEEFFLATGDSHHPTVVRSWRDRNDDSVQCETFHGWLDIQFVGIVVPSKEIKKLVESKGLLAGDDADLFASAIRSAFQNYKSEIGNDLRRETIGRITESSHPLVADYTLLKDEEVIDGILYTLDQIFCGKKDEIKDFIKRHREYLMTIKVVRKFRVFKAE